jgi:hypothetical protein
MNLKARVALKTPKIPQFMEMYRLLLLLDNTSGLEFIPLRWVFQGEQLLLKLRVHAFRDEFSCGLCLLPSFRTDKRTEVNAA